VCVHGLVFTKAMNTRCGINSNDGLNAFEIVWGRKKEEKNSIGHSYILQTLSEGVSRILEFSHRLVVLS